MVRQVDEQVPGPPQSSLPVVAMAGMITSAASIAARYQKCAACSRCEDNITAVRKIRSKQISVPLPATDGRKMPVKCEDPVEGFARNFRLHAEDMAVSGSNSRHEGNIDAKDHKQYKEDRHHHFIGLFDATSNAVHRDKHADYKSSQLPEIISPGREAMHSNLVPRTQYPAGAGGACKGSRHISEDPSHNNQYNR